MLISCKRYDKLYMYDNSHVNKTKPYNDDVNIQFYVINIIINQTQLYF